MPFHPFLRPSMSVHRTKTNCTCKLQKTAKQLMWHVRWSLVSFLVLQTILFSVKCTNRQKTIVFLSCTSSTGISGDVQVLNLWRHQRMQSQLLLGSQGAAKSLLNVHKAAEKWLKSGFISNFFVGGTPRPPRCVLFNAILWYFDVSWHDAHQKSNGWNLQTTVSPLLKRKSSHPNPIFFGSIKVFLFVFWEADFGISSQRCGRCHRQQDWWICEIWSGGLQALVVGWSQPGRLVGNLAGWLVIL